MCGIYGSTIPYKKDEIIAKLKRTNFRGPDKSDHRYYKNESIIFGHNRLAIVDLDERSNQPFTYHNIHIVFNGEIFNFKDIRNTLKSKGFEFRTESDTEVVCAAYLEYGEKCVDHFNGMFAFVIYDVDKNEFFGARDRLGQKPFYYYHNGTEFEFSSQISSIQLFNDKLSISSKSIGYYLAWGNVPDPHSIFNEIKKLKAGHYFKLDLDSGELKTTEYWDIDYKKTEPFKGSYQDAIGELDTLLTDATSIRMFADVPVGVFLSGGIDSSLVAALASKTATNSKIKTFAVKFNESKFDESKYAKKVANHLNTEHHEILCNADEGIDLIHDFATYYDEPFADSSAIPSMLLAKHTRKHVTVALSGDAGDENFLGYSRYQQNSTKNVYDYPYALRKVAGHILKKIPNYKLNVMGKALLLKDLETYYRHSIIGVDHSWFKTDFDVLDVPERKYIEHNERDIYERMGNFDLKTYLNWDINTKVDRATMAFSLEARSPIMDYRVVEMANSLPSDFKMKGNNQKRILKDVLYQYVPEAYFDRPKAGFTMPFSEWFKTNLKDYVLDELSPDALKNIPMIDEKNVTYRINQHMDGSWNRYPLIWKLLVLKQWLNKNKGTYSIK
jgi:asparagine synthase (glutamine-hydrolysing)